MTLDFAADYPLHPYPQPELNVVTADGASVGKFGRRDVWIRMLNGDFLEIEVDVLNIRRPIFQ